MNKSQRDYAIKRATKIIKDQENENFNEIPSEVSAVLEYFGLDPEGCNSYRLASYLIENASEFEGVKQDKAELERENQVVYDKISERVNAAKDFIMLGDNKSILQYLSDLEND